MQLRRSEKELVGLYYKEDIKGFTLKGIQQYIASKIKMWIVVLFRRLEERRTGKTKNSISDKPLMI